MITNHSKFQWQYQSSLQIPVGWRPTFPKKKITRQNLTPQHCIKKCQNIAEARPNPFDLKDHSKNEYHHRRYTIDTETKNPKSSYQILCSYFSLSLVVSIKYVHALIQIFFQIHLTSLKFPPSLSADISNHINMGSSPSIQQKSYMERDLSFSFDWECIPEQHSSL